MVIVRWREVAGDACAPYRLIDQEGIFLACLNARQRNGWMMRKGRCR